MGKTVIFYNGHITTLDPTCPQAEALAVQDGRIIAMGSNEDIMLHFGRGEYEKVDLEGGYAYPGLVDSHMHLSGIGQQLRWMDLSDCRSKEKLLELVRKRAKQGKDGEWILGMGFKEDEIDGGIPTLDELDEASMGKPLFLARSCLHTYVVNRYAYQAAGVTRDTPDPENGQFGRDEAGNLNGWVYENASAPFYQAQPKPTFQEKKEQIRQAMKLALAAGLTGVHTDDLRYLGTVDDCMRIYRELLEEGIYLRTHHLIYYPHLTELDEGKWKPGQKDEWIGIGGMKIFSDGSIGGRTAWLSEPYADAPDTRGIPIHDWDELCYLAAQAADRHMPLAIHAIGDAAAERVLALMEAYPVKAEWNHSLRHRLIHGQILRPDLIEKLKRMDIAVDIQPRFVASDFPWVLDRIGSDRSSTAYAWRTLLEAGIHCAGGSDAPVEPLHPLLGIHAAVTRRRLDDPADHPGYIPEQKLNPLEAMLLFTQGSAYAAGEEHERGTLSVGKYADLSVYDRDLLNGEIDGLLEAKTWFTIVNGRVAYQHQ